MIRTNWETEPPVEVWRRPIGPGFSSMVVASGRVFTQDSRSVAGSNREFAVCLDAETGEEVWSVNVDLASYTDLSGYDDRMDGPRSTPSVDGDYVYFATSYLKLFCLNVADGSEVWMRDFRAELGSSNISWENCASPLVVGDLLFLNANSSDSRLMALNKLDGSTVWGNPDDIAARQVSDRMTHATPVYAEIEGVPQIVFLTGSGLISVVPESGDVLWNLGFSPSATSTAATPLVVDDLVHATAAYSSGMWVARVVKGVEGFSASELYRERGNAYQMHWATPVRHEGFIYGIPSPSSSQGRLACLDLTTGENRWTQTAVGSDRIGYGSLIKAANVLVVLTEGGELVLVEPNPEAYLEIARFQALDEFCWNSVALANGRIYARSTSPTAPEIVVLDVSIAGESTLPDVTISAEWMITGQTIRFVVRAADGGALDASHAVEIEMSSSADLGASRATWAVIPAGFTLADGALVADVDIGSEPALYFQTRKKAAQ